MMALGVLVQLGPAQTAEARHHRVKGDKSPAAAQGSSVSVATSELEPPPAGEPGAPDYAALLRGLEEGYRKAPGPEALYRLGQLAYIAGRTVEAQDFMRRYLADPLTEPLADTGATHRFEAQRIAELPRMPSGEVQVAAEQEGLISVDGRLVGALPLPLPLLVPAGQHVVSLELREKTMKGKIKVLDGRGAVMRFSLESGAVLVTLPPAVIVLPRYIGRFASDVQRRMQQLTEQRLLKARLAAYSKEAALARAPESAKCQTTQRCQVELCRKSEVEYALPLVVEQRGSDVALQLQLVDSETEAVAASAERVCSGCTMEAVAVVLGELVDRLLKAGAGRSRGTLAITSQPPGAEVRDGKRLLGKTPYEHLMFAGSYALSVELPSFMPGRVEVAVFEGKKATAEVTLVASAVIEVAKIEKSIKPARSLRPRWRIITGAALLGTGLILSGVGISGIALDNGCAVQPESPLGQCRERFDTLSTGGALLGVGLGLSVAGTILIAVPHFPGER